MNRVHHEKRRMPGRIDRAAHLVDQEVQPVEVIVVHDANGP